VWRISPRLTSLFVVLLGLGVAPGPSSAAVDVQSFLTLYQYDRTQALNVVSSGKSDRGYHTAEGIRYDSVNGENVPAYLFLPKATPGPHPCILLLHGYGGSKDDSLLPAAAFLATGIAVFAPDMQYHGDRAVAGKDIFSADVLDNRAAMIQTIVDCRRAIDFLETRPEIDAKRIAFVGVSLGGILGGVLSGVDQRIKAVVLIVAGGDWGSLLLKSQIGAAKKIRELHPGLKSEQIAELMDPVDPINFIGRVSPRPLLMQNGNQDNIVPVECNNKLYDAAGQPKNINWYDAGHAVPLLQVFPKVLTWIKQNL